MKHNLKRILPILLVIVVICSIVWYLFVYDRDFTRDMLIGQARYFEDIGEHSIAAWLYNQAYIQSGEDETVAIELAERFKAIGNYTKAEHTLSNAIADGGSAELYIALCRTYLEQDKLLDAVTMLDSISDPVVKAELDSMRPAAPTISHTPGFYNQYITVTVEGSGGKLFVSADSRYPSVTDEPGSPAVTLVAGENTVCALILGDNGLVSPLAEFNYIVGGVIEKVTLTDSSIDALVRQHLQMGSTTTIYTNDLWNIPSLTMPESAQTSSDLVHFPYLQSLTVENSTIDSWTSLSALTQLTELTFRNCLLSSETLQIISALPKLEKLTLADCTLSNITSLSGARGLTYLDLSGNAIRDLAPLSYLSNLKQLDLDHNAVNNLSALSPLAALETLDVSYNDLSTVIPLSGCTALKVLDISNNTIADLAGLSGLTGLTDLNASYNALADVSQLSGCAVLKELDISNNVLTDISALSALKGLEYLNFSRNQVTALPAWEKGCALVTIDGSYNQVTTVASLAGYAHLNNILMDYNQISSVNALASCPHLVSVSVYGNPVSDVSVLKDMSVIVNYTPAT